LSLPKSAGPAKGRCTPPATSIARRSPNDHRECAFLPIQTIERPSALKAILRRPISRALGCI
jgi:hypothetical protein